MTYADPLSNNRQGEGKRQSLGAKLLVGLAGRYRAIRKRLSELLGRGDPDYATMSSLSQEIGRMRQAIRKISSSSEKRASRERDRLRDRVATVGRRPPV